MLYCMCIIVKRNYSTLNVGVISCEIQVLIYTFLRLLENENYRRHS